MASGNTLLVFGARAANKPASNYPQFAVRNNHPIQKFDAGTEEACYFEAALPRNYAGGGLTIYLTWMATSATSGNVVWGASIERMNTDLDADSFASEITATGAANGTAGIVTSTSIAFTNGAQMDSAAVGEMIRIKIARKAADGSDTMTGDAELVGIEIKET